jgi:hypothetical protein
LFFFVAHAIRAFVQSDSVLQIDSEFTRPGVVCMLRQLREKVESTNENLQLDLGVATDVITFHMDEERARLAQMLH